MRLRTLGSLLLEETDFSRPKPLLLLTYLLLEGPQDRRHLAELFWADARDHMKSLTVALSRLRKGAPGMVEADNERAWGTGEVDVRQLLTFLEQGEWERALELYRGPFLAGFYLRNWSAELEEWVYKTREFLAGRVRMAMLELAEREAAQARFEAASKRAEAAYELVGAAALEPEDLSRLHTLLCAGGSPHAAEVREEASAFDIEVVRSSAEARRRLQQVGPHSTPHNLPTRGTAFLSRDLELTEVVTLLSKPHCRLLTLLGPAGVGKTRLALQVAEEWLSLASFQDGVCWVSLAPLASSDLLPSAVADALGLVLKSHNEAWRQVSDHIGNKDLLLLLDNFEHLMNGAVMASELVTACPKLKVLVTSRERLNLEEERIFPLAGLPFPKEASTPEEAQRFDAVRLFVRRAKRANPAFELTEENLPGVLKICRLVEGLPLGLELASVWVRAMSCQDIAQELEANLDLLATPTRNVPERHQSLRSAFEQSWKLLSAKEQEVLRKVSVFRGGFRREAASDMAAATIPILASLVDKSLLRVDQSDRYNRHPLLYRYTQEKSANHPKEQAELRAKHAVYFLRLAEESRLRLVRPEAESEKGALKTLTAEVENLRAAFTWSLKNNRLLALQLTIALRTFWEIRGHLVEACHWLEAALAEPSKAVPLRTMFAAHAAYGRFLLLRGQKLAAEEQFNAALEVTRVTGHPRDTAEALNQLGLLALERRDYQRAQSCCERALSLHRAHANKRGIAVTLNNLGNIVRAQHDPARAATLYQESLALHRELGIRRSEAVALGNLGFVARQQGELARAAKLLEESIAIRSELKDEIGLAHSFLGLAALACEEQAYERAAKLLGATDRLLEVTSMELALTDHGDYEQAVASTRAKLTQRDFERLWAEGYAMSTNLADGNTCKLAGFIRRGDELFN